MSAVRPATGARIGAGAAMSYRAHLARLAALYGLSKAYVGLSMGCMAVRDGMSVANSTELASR